jgi:hypothetical protein
MKKEMKRVNKKVLVLSLVLLSLLVINLVLLKAAEPVPTGVPSSEGDTSSGFFDRWVSGAFHDRDAKIIVWFITTIVLFLIMYAAMDQIAVPFFISIPGGFLLSAFVTPASVIGIIRSYDTLPLVFLTFLPLGVLFMVTYISVVKGNRTLMTTQWLLWCIYFVYIFVKLFCFLYLFYGGGWLDWLNIPDYVFQTFLTNLPEAGTQAYVWFWFTILISTLISAAMAFLNGVFMNFAMVRSIGIDKSKARESLSNLQTGGNALIEFGKQLEGKGHK